MKKTRLNIKDTGIMAIVAVLLLLCITIPSELKAQDEAVLKGQILNEKKRPVPFMLVQLVGKPVVQSDSSGSFIIKGLKYDVDYTLNLSQFGQKSRTIPVRLKKGTPNFYSIEVEEKSTKIKGVVVEFKKEEERTRAGVTKINPRDAKFVTSVFGDFSKTLTTLAGVSSNNELSSTYSVRGGNFDENLVYVNGIEIYRPFLIRSGQQEGLSFVNPDLVGDITFSAGGWQPKYGDKLSSVLDIQYRKPSEFGGSVTAGRLGGALHLQDISKDERFTYLVGIRYKDSRAALGRLQTQAEFRPKFVDVQSYMTYDLTNRKKYSNESGRASIEALLSYAQNDYYIEPESKTTTFGAITTSIKRLFVAYDGYESMNYNTYQGGLKFKQRFNQKLKTSVTTSLLRTTEREFFDLEAGYRLCDIKVDFGDNENLDKCFLEQDIGTEFKYARNTLNALILNVDNRWTLLDDSGKHSWEWGVRYGSETIDDEISEYEFIDSADFANVTRLLRSQIDLNSGRFQAFGQHSIEFDSGTVFTYGVRSSYWTVNKNLTLSPRAQFSWKPKWERDYVFRLAAGVYHQPPFYRELRDDLGQINKDVTAQRSVHLVAGSDYKFKMWNRDFKLVSEMYYKDVQNVVPYEYNDVKIRYKAHNNAKAYSTGIDFRLSGEFIKDTESWFSLGFLQTREDLDNAFYTQIINEVPVDAESGFVPRPTDQLVTFGVFFQDQLPNNPTVKMYMNMVFGSGLPFSPPNAVKYKYVDDLGVNHQTYGRLQSYRRVDVGFSKLLIFRDNELGSEKPKLKSLWLGVEILNIIGANNTISVSWIKDTYNTVYGIPNFLSARLLNVKMIAKF